MTTGQIAAQIETTFRREHGKVLAVLIATLGNFALAIANCRFPAASVRI